MVWGAAGLSVIDRLVGEAIAYAGDGLADPLPLVVPWSDLPADPFQGAGATARKVTCEFNQGELPARPNRSSRVTRAGIVWKVIDVTDRDDIGKWVCALERIGPA
jgi:hypothetical protein